MGYQLACPIFLSHDLSADPRADGAQNTFPSNQRVGSLLICGLNHGNGNTILPFGFVKAENHGKSV
jgi:hypothetical protein